MVRDCKRYVKYGGPCSGLAVSQRGSLFIVEGPCGGVGLMRLRPWPRQLCHHFAVRCGRLRCGVAGAAGVAFLWAWVAPRGGLGGLAAWWSVRGRGPFGEGGLIP